MAKKSKNTDGFIIELWANIFNVLSKISIYYFVKKIKKNISYTFVEGWVLGNLIAAIALTGVGYYLGNKIRWILYVILMYAILRVFEVIIYQLNVLFFDPYRAEKQGKKYKIKSPTRMVILLLHNYVEVMLWYAAIIIAMIQLSGNSIDATWGECVRYNVLCIATFDSSGIQEIAGAFYPKLSIIVFLQILSGIIMTIISLARFIGLMPSVESVDN